jgi:hypothetical protein
MVRHNRTCDAGHNQSSSVCAPSSMTGQNVGHARVIATMGDEAMPLNASFNMRRILVRANQKEGTED